MVQGVIGRHRRIPTSTETALVTQAPTASPVAVQSRRCIFGSPGVACAPNQSRVLFSVDVKHTPTYLAAMRGLVQSCQYARSLVISEIVRTSDG